MKIVFTGGGTGGHFYPIIAIAESIRKIVKEKRLVDLDLFFFGPTPYNQGILYDHGIEYKKVFAGKMRRYFSVFNFTDLFKTAFGFFGALLNLFDVFPDVVFSKGGFGSFPTVLAARILRIPVVLHESDSAPGRVNKWTGKFATRIALSYKDAAEYFDSKKIAFTGQPVLEDRITRLTTNAFEFFELDKNVPVIFIMGGSQGAEVINNAVMDSLPSLVRDYQVLHQTGAAHLEVMKESASAVLLGNENKSRYRPFGYMNSFEMRMAAGASSVVISRAGSTIFEIASWEVPSIIIPIADSNENHQVKNAFAYAHSGACSVIQEENLKTHILLAEIKRILENEEIMQKMREGAKKFFKPGAADQIARELVAIALAHQKLD